MQRKCVPTKEQRKFVELMSAAHLPWDQMCQVIINSRTKKPISKGNSWQGFQTRIGGGAIKNETDGTQQILGGASAR
jgi:hypothetical protein